MTRGNYLLQVLKYSASKSSACPESAFANFLTLANRRVGSYPEPRPGDIPTHLHPEQVNLGIKVDQQRLNGKGIYGNKRTAFEIVEWSNIHRET